MANTNSSETSSYQPTATQSDTPMPLTMAALAHHNATQHTAIQAEAGAIRARQEAVQSAAQSMSFRLPNEDPWTGRRPGDGWLDHQNRTYGRYVDPKTGEKKE